MARYTVVLQPDEIGFFVKVPALKGCITQGRDEEDAVIQAKEAVDAWCDTAKEGGMSIPEDSPVQLEDYGGTVILRIVEVDV